MDFEEHGRKTFSLFPYGPTEAQVIELFPGANWITLTTRLFDLGELPQRGLKSIYEKLLKANATLVEVNFGIDKRNCLMIRNAVPVTGISYDTFNSAYEAHLAGIKFFHEKMKPHLRDT